MVIPMVIMRRVIKGLHCISFNLQIADLILPPIASLLWVLVLVIWVLHSIASLVKNCLLDGW